MDQLVNSPLTSSGLQAGTWESPVWATDPASSHREWPSRRLGHTHTLPCRELHGQTQLLTQSLTSLSLCALICKMRDSHLFLIQQMLSTQLWAQHRQQLLCPWLYASQLHFIGTRADVVGSHLAPESQPTDDYFEQRESHLQQHQSSFCNGILPLLTRLGS